MLLLRVKEIRVVSNWFQCLFHMLNRVKCYLVNEATGEQKQFVVPVSSNFSSMKEFAEFAIKEYAGVSSVVSLFLVYG